MKPLMNLADAEFDDVEDNGYYTSKRGTLGSRLGAQRRGQRRSIQALSNARPTNRSGHVSRLPKSVEASLCEQ